jgi:UDP-N-acetylmuramate dehydrogenase
LLLQLLTNNFALNIITLNIQQNISLKSFNTFSINAKAKYFATFTTVDELRELLNYKLETKSSKLILGGGSNILFTKDFDGLVLKNELHGIELIKEDKHHYYVKAAAGENWNNFVMHCIHHNYAGLENLSLIPGNVGASPMQNIGAYGAELKDVFESLEAMNRKDLSVHTFSANDCAFGYRESIFKTKYKNEFVILNVTFRLNKEPVFNTSYDALQQELEKMNVQKLSIQAISQAVINIRTSKLPDPKQIGNAGSFFKNPIITKQHFNELKKQYADIPGYAADNVHVKVAAGWLIEQCGWKGYRKNDAGVHAKQALVLVNYGNATGKEIFHLSEEIKHSVKKKFNIELEREVNVVNGQ